MKSLVHNVLGTPYDVLLGDRKDIGMPEDRMGECRPFGKKILVSTDGEDFEEGEIEVRVQETVAHEIFHAYCNEAGVDLDEDTEEMVASFFMKTWRKMYNSILEVLDETGFLDK